MNNFSKAQIVLLAVASHSVASAQPALEPATAASIVSAARSCVDSVTPTAVDESRLASDGWRPGKITKDGQEIEASLRFYGRGNDNVLLMIMAGEGAGGCSLMARIDQVAEYQNVASALAAELGAKPFQSKASEATWLVQRKAVQLSATGTQEKPAVRIAVIYLPERKK